MIDNVITSENVRRLFIVTCAQIAAFLSPVGGSIGCVVLFSMFNIWAGMRADGVCVVSARIERFSWSKISKAFTELTAMLAIIVLITIAMTMQKDQTAMQVIVKTFSYLVSYYYFQNSLKNLIIVYPKNVAVRVLYHFIRLEFKNAFPANVRKAMETAEKEIQDKKDDAHENI